MGRAAGLVQFMCGSKRQLHVLGGLQMKPSVRLKPIARSSRSDGVATITAAVVPSQTSALFLGDHMMIQTPIAFESLILTQAGGSANLRARFGGSHACRTREISGPIYF